MVVGDGDGTRGYVVSLEDINAPILAIERHNLPDHYDDELDEIIYKEWIKAHDDKIGRLQSEMILVQREIHKLREELKQCTKN